MAIKSLKIAGLTAATFTSLLVSARDTTRNFDMKCGGNTTTHNKIADIQKFNIPQPCVINPINLGNIKAICMGGGIYFRKGDGPMNPSTNKYNEFTLALDGRTPPRSKMTIFKNGFGNLIFRLERYIVTTGSIETETMMLDQNVDPSTRCDVVALDWLSHPPC